MSVWNGEEGRLVAPPNASVRATVPPYAALRPDPGHGAFPLPLHFSLEVLRRLRSGARYPVQVPARDWLGPAGSGKWRRGGGVKVEQCSTGQA